MKIVCSVAAMTLDLHFFPFYAALREILSVSGEGEGQVGMDEASYIHTNNRQTFLRGLSMFVFCVVGGLWLIGCRSCCRYACRSAAQ